MDEKKEQLDVLKWLLEQIFRAENHKKDLEERLLRINEERNAPIGGMGYDPLPRSSGTGNGAASILFKLADVEERIYAQKEEVEKCIVRVMDILEYLPVNSLERRICELRYLDMKPWGEISKRIPMSRSQCHRRCNEGLEKILSHSRIQKMVQENTDAYWDFRVNEETRMLKADAQKSKVGGMHRDSISEKNRGRKKKGSH